MVPTTDSPENEDLKPHALHNIWQTDNHQPRQYPYKRVQVLLLSWKDDDMRVANEVKPLHDVFKDICNFEVSYLFIPSSKPRRYIKKRLSKYRDTFNSLDTLFILYYAGHGDRRGNNLVWCPDSGRDADKPWKLKDVQISWSEIQKKYLENALCDVFLILDCCHAAAAAHAQPSRYENAKKKTHASQHTMEILAACGFESSCISPCRKSFSHALIKALSFFLEQDEPFSAADLHLAIVQRLMKADKKLMMMHNPLVVKDRKLTRSGKYLMRSDGGLLILDRKARREIHTATPVFVRLCGHTEAPSIQLRGLPVNEGNDDKVTHRGPQGEPMAKAALKGLWKRLLRR